MDDRYPEHVCRDGKWVTLLWRFFLQRRPKKVSSERT